jgi:glycosyltransferase involved in cell wall biosynthesis
MRVVMVSKALVVGAAQRKLEEIAGHDEIDLTAIVPATWDGRPYEPGYTSGYRTLIQPIRFDGNFHVFYLPTLGRVLRDLKPDLVHIDEEPINLATVLATKQALAAGARPLFFTWQNINRPYPPPFRWFETYVYQRSAYAIAGNAEAVDVLRAKGYSGPSTVIPQFGVDPDLFVPSAKSAALGSRPFTIGAPNRLEPHKGVDWLLEAVAGLAGDWRLRFVGTGPMAGEIPAKAAALGIGDRVTVERPVPSRDVPALLHKFDVVVLPSLTTHWWKEQFGRVLIEGMACQVPVVGSDSGEIPHVIGDAGLVVREANVEDLRSAFGRLMSEPALRRDLGQRGRARVLEQFTQARVAARTVEVYREVMGREHQRTL